MHSGGPYTDNDEASFMVHAAYIKYPAVWPINSEGKKTWRRRVELGKCLQNRFFWVACIDTPYKHFKSAT